ASLAGNPFVTSTNVTVPWYGTRGWYTIQGSPDLINWINLGSAVAATDYSWSATVTNPFGLSGNFRLSQANSYAGQGNCGSCHGDKYLSWSGTAHASALSVLGANSSNTRCLQCHTVGFGQPTGYTNQALTPYLANVGCE